MAASDDTQGEVAPRGGRQNEVGAFPDPNGNSRALCAHPFAVCQRNGDKVGYVAKCAVATLAMDDCFFVFADEGAGATGLISRVANTR